MTDATKKISLLDAIIERYINDEPIASSDGDISIVIKSLPVKVQLNQSGVNEIDKVCLDMSCQNITHIGDSNQLEIICKNVEEIYLSKNEIIEWNEVKKILESFKKLRLLNLSSNPLDKSSALIDWPSFANLNVLVLNSCFVDLSTIECLCARLNNLNELHLSSNNYSTVNFTQNFSKPFLKILYFMNNNLTNWSEVCKLGKCFPNLKSLFLGQNNLTNFDSTEFSNNICFENLQTLFISDLKIVEWSVFERLRDFPQLKHIRLQNIPLLNPLKDEEKYYLLVAHLHDSIESLNGSKILSQDRDKYERKYIRYFMDAPSKPERYYELEKKHGKLDKLVDVSLEVDNRVQVKIKFGEKHVYEKVDVRQSVREFKKKLEQFVGHPSSKFRLFFIDIEATRISSNYSIPNTEELRASDRKLFSFNVRDGDEFEIDLK